jgi:hypothetical protein
MRKFTVLRFVRSGLTEYLFRGRTQVEAGSRTVLGIGPGKSPVVSGEIVLIICTFLHSTSRLGQPGDGTPPVTLDVSYKILIHTHVDLTTRTRLLQHFTRPPLTNPFIRVQVRKRKAALLLSDPSHATHTLSQSFLLHGS